MTTVALLTLAVVGIAVLLFLVIVVRLQAFLALLIASLFVAVVGGVPIADVATTIQEGMGSTLGYIAVVIGVGAMFGEMLQVSGGAERIATSLVKRFGEERAPYALGLTGLIVSTPVFFDVALILFIPLVYSLARRSGRSLLYYGIPLVAGMAVAHAFIPPTPGPVAVAGLLEADLGWVIFFGLLAGVPATFVAGILYGRYISERMRIEVPTLASAAETDHSDRPDLPSFGVVMTLIVVPIVLILLNTLTGILLPEESQVRQLMAFIGHPFTALILATLFTFYLLGTRRGYSREDIQRIATRGLEPVGMIILVTGAGGVFGRVLIETGVGSALADVMAASQLPLVLLAFLIALVVRISQGSATVSMVTAAGLIAPVVAVGDFSQPMLAALTVSIAAGATAVSHVNDSGFWLVSRFMGMTEKQTLQSWTVMATIVAVVGLAVILVVSLFL